MSGERIERLSVNFEPKNQHYLIKSVKYEKQYNQIYLKRLAATKDNLCKQAVGKWGPDVPILEKIIDSEIKAHEGDVILVGTIFKELNLRGSVLDEFKENNGISGAVQSLSNISSPLDSLIIEDSSGRAALGGNISHLASRLVSGVGVAVRGTCEGGIFMVTDWVFAHSITPISRTTLSTAITSTNTTDKYVLLVSGLQLGAVDQPTNETSELSNHMLIDFIAGRLGDEKDTQLASQIVRVIVAGNSVKAAEQMSSKDRYASQKTMRDAATPNKHLDILLSQLLGCCPLDIMPGSTDPATLSFPQQPLHPCLFPHASRFSTFHRSTNPYQATLDNLLITGTSGQSITDIARQTILPIDYVQKNKKNGNENADEEGFDETKMDVTTPEEQLTATAEGVAAVVDNDCIDILQNTLEWGHLCPTVPDTLPCYPFQDSDPFIIAPYAIPAVLFAGNQPKFATSLVKSAHSNKENKLTRVVCIPVFKHTGIAVLVNISREDLECTTISFK